MFFKYFHIQKVLSVFHSVASKFCSAAALSAHGHVAVIAEKSQNKTHIFVHSDTQWNFKTLSGHGGSSVDISADGKMIAIGNDTVSDMGSVAVLFESDTFWFSDTVLIPFDSTLHGLFGTATALSADKSTLLVGAPGNSIGINGFAYVFVHSDTLWVLQTKLSDGGGAANDLFGTSVDLSADGNTALIGSKTDTVGFNSSQGSVSVFNRSDVFWTQATKLTGSDGNAGDQFGNSVSLSADGTVAVVGASMDDIHTNSNQGSAHVFSKQNNAWTQEARLVMSDGSANDNFGQSVVLSADATTVLIGAPGANKSHVFKKLQNQWHIEETITESDVVSGDGFGSSVMLSANGVTALVGAPSMNLDTGSGYFYSFRSLPDPQFHLSLAGLTPYIFIAVICLYGWMLTIFLFHTLAVLT